MRVDTGGHLIRYPGGFWMRPDLEVGNHTWLQDTWFGTTTIQALVARGELEYTKWQEGRNGRFPIEASIAG